jgi:hypothetical protein
MATTVAAVLLISSHFHSWLSLGRLVSGRIFDIAPLLQPLFEGPILLAAVSDINLK